MHEQRTAGPKRSSRGEKLEPGLWERPNRDGTKSYPSVVYVDNSEVWETFTNVTRTQARELHKERQVAAARGVTLVRTNRKLRDVGPEFIASIEGRLAARTVENYSYFINQRLIPLLGSREMAKIDVETVARGVIARMKKEGRSAANINGALDVLSRLFSFAIRRGYATVNPVGLLERGERPKRESDEPRVLTTAEIERIRAAGATDITKLLVQLLAQTGLRISEALGLTWAEIDLTGNTITVRHQLGRGADPTLEELKTAKSRRVVPIVPQLHAALNKRRATAFAAGHAKSTDPVFATASGKHLTQRNAARSITQAATKAGISRPLPSAHDFRHTYATRLILDAKLDAHRIAAILGHTNPGFTLSTYVHAFATRDDGLRDQIAATALGAIGGAS